MPRSFLRELKRRKVYRVAVAYAIVGWLLIQIATQVFPYFRIPDWTVRVLVLLVLAGFPIALVLAWAFDATPQGIVRADTEGQPVLRRSRRGTIAVAAIGVAVAVIAGVGYWTWHREPVQRIGMVSAAARAPDIATRNAAPARSPEAPRSPDADRSSDAAKRNPEASIPDSAAAAASSGPESANAPIAPIPAKSVAVLPFENLSTDKANAYFADGMQDLILTKLADIGDLKVISRTSTEQYGSHPGNLRMIARQLGVATILEGSVQKAGNQVLINVQLIDARTDAHIWAQSYTRTLDNIFGVEGEVAQKVADALNAKLTPVEAARVAKVPTQNAAAYDLFLKGEYYFNRASSSLLKSDYDAAVENYHGAIQQDPKFALAYARMAIAQLFQLHVLGDDGSHLAAQAKVAVDRALQWGPALADAHSAEGFYRDYALHDLPGALASFNAALAIKPRDSFAIFATAVIYKHLGQWDAAIAAYQRAIALDPRNVLTMADFSATLTDLRRYTEAEQVLRRALAVDPASVRAVAHLARAILAKAGQPERAMAVLDAAPASVQNNPRIVLRRARLLFDRRNYPAARRLVTTLKPGGGVTNGDIEIMFGSLEWASGDPTAARLHYLRAASWLEAALKSGSGVVEPGELGWVYARLGRKRDALEQGRRGIRLHPMDKDVLAANSALLDMAMIQVQVGEVAAAVTGLDRLLSSSDGGIVSVPLLKVDPRWDAIRHDPRFQALLKKYAHAEPAPASSEAGHD